MRRRAAGAILATVFVAACGGSSPSTPTPPPSPTPAAGGPVVLDPATFASLVLAAPQPCLVEFQRPT